MTAEERREYNRRWRESHKGYDKEYYNSNKIRIRAARLIRYRRKRKQENERSHQYYISHRDELLERAKEVYKLKKQNK